MAPIVRAFLVAGLVGFVGCARDVKLDSRLTPLAGAGPIELFSLDPAPAGASEGGSVKGGFHGWRILGSTSVTDAVARKSLIDALNQGIVESDGTVANCFNPRHGIRIVTDGKKTEYVICFECLQVEVHVDDKATGGFITTSSPQTTLDAALQAAGVTLTSHGG